jgi:cyclohexadienyl dehydratase
MNGRLRAHLVVSTSQQANVARSRRSATVWNRLGSRSDGPNVRRLTSRVTSALAVATLGAACGSTPPAAAPALSPDISHITTQGAVRVCSTGDYRPFSYRDPQGQWSGMDIDLARDLAQRLGVQLNIVGTTWGTMMADLGAHCDVAMGGVSITLDRTVQALYSTPYLRDGKAAVVRCDDQSKYQTLDNIDEPGVRVVVNPSGTNADFVQAHIHRATIVDYPDNNTIFGQVIDNKADVMFTDASEIRFR